MPELTEVDFQIILEMADNNMNETETARVLFMHRNNVVYHIQKIKRLTGLDAAIFYDLVKLVEIARNGGAGDGK